LKSDQPYWGGAWFFSIPRGVALAIPFVRISPEGAPLPGSARFNIDIPRPKVLSWLPDWLKTSYDYEEWRVRAIVFALTSERWVNDSVPSSFERQRSKLKSGAQRADGPLVTPVMTSKHRLFANIYEYVSIDGVPYEYVPHSSVSGRHHLEQSGIETGLPAAPSGPQ
jgi:hypothetical protein